MFEVITTDDKVKRDDLYRQYRESGNELEKQVVKFSSMRFLLNPEVPGEILLDNKGRCMYTQTWSIAYPTERTDYGFDDGNDSAKEEIDIFGQTDEDVNKAVAG